MSESKSTYLDILISSLEKKSEVLDSMKEHTLAQQEALLKEEFDEALFEKAYEEKEKLLPELRLLDEGFEDVYRRVSEELKRNSETYRAQLERMQQLIMEITTKSNSLLSLEESNKNHFQMMLARGRKRIKEFRVSSKTAAAYYKNMSGTHKEEQSYFCDRKK